MAFLPLAPLGILLAGVLLQVLLGRALTNRGKGWLAFACGLGALAATLAMLPSTAAGQAYSLTLANWDAGIPLVLRVDGLSMLFALMGAGIGSAILFYCVDYMAHEPSGVTRFYALMLTFIAGLISLVFSANLLLAYFSWEVIGLCSYFLVGFWYKEPAAAAGARKVLVMTHLPGYGLLVAILLLYSQSGTLLWTDPAVASHFSLGIFLLMLVAAMAKSVMVPLHTWIPEAMNAPTPVSALLHSACYVKAGIYLVARMYSLNGSAPWAASWSTLVMAIGCATMLVGALFALAQTDLKRLLAYSTISQLGYIVAALGMGPVAGLYAATFYTFSHGLFKGTLFLCAGAVQHAAGTRDMRRLGGLAARMPWTAAAWLVAACAIIGVPLTNGFIAKWLLFDAALRSGFWVVAVVAWLVSILTAFYMLKATVSVFYGDLPVELRAAPVEDAPRMMRLGMAFLALLCLVFGVAPQILARWVTAPAAIGLTGPADAASFAVRVNQALTSAPSLAGAALVAGAVLLAGLVYLLARPVKSTASVSVFAGGDPLSEAEAPGAEDFADLAQTTLTPVYAVTDPDPFYRLIWRAVQGAAAWAGRSLAPLERRSLLATLALAVLIAAAAWLR